MPARMAEHVLLADECHSDGEGGAAASRAPRRRAAAVLLAALVLASCGLALRTALAASPRGTPKVVPAGAAEVGLAEQKPSGSKLAVEKQPGDSKAAEKKPGGDKPEEKKPGGIKPEEKTKEPGANKAVVATCTPAGQNCSAAQCCSDQGLQCYAKDNNWAECRGACTPGPDPRSADGWPWSCKELGPRAPGAAPVCSAMGGTDCTQSRCCADSGMQCYEKNAGYATCMAECTPGIDLTDEDPTPWTCNALGPRTADLPAWVAQVCAPPGASCFDKSCCSSPGMQCFEKDPYYGECLSECATDWSCVTRGSRTPLPALQPWQTQRTVASWVAEKCSKEGSDCRESKCCSAAGNQCFEKNSTLAVCKGGCAAGPDLYDSDPSAWTCNALGPRTPGQPTDGPWKQGIEVSKWVASTCAAEFSEDCSKSRCCSKVGDQCYEKGPGWAACMPGCTPGPLAGDVGNWTCKELGPRTMRAWGKPSMFCFAVIQPTGYEGPLVAAQMQAGAGIFGCDEYSVFSTATFFLGTGPLGPVHTVSFVPAQVVQSKDGTAGNAELFIHVWDSVRNQGVYESTDWTVKCDPDAVVLPDRLRWHLEPHTGTSAFMVNCAKPYMPEGPMMFGALEAITRQALETYYSKEGDCIAGLPWKIWGEDLFMGKCLEKLGVAKQYDFQIYSDGVCTVVDCGDPDAAAFHPKKDIGSWFACLEQSKNPHERVTTDAPQWYKDYMVSYAR